MKVDNKNILSRIWKLLILNQWVLLFFVVLIISGVTGSINVRFFAKGNIINILEQISVLGLISAGATILIISGNFDISVGSMVGLSTSIMAILMINGVNEGLASVIGIIICVLCSTLNGVLSVVFKAPSFIISLATSGIFYGIALSITQGIIQTIYGKFELIAGTRLFEFFPLIFFISIIGYLFVHFILIYTQIGRRIYAIGSNQRAAFLAGINVNANKILFFAISGFLVGVSSVLILSRLGGALPSTGAGIELRAIGAVVIGGVPITGGSGNILGTFFGVLLMGVISNSLNMLRINPYFQEMAYGILIIIAIAISSLRYRNSGIK
ncbi:Ribose import permease protein RbsC [subsurface metagenome]